MVVRGTRNTVVVHLLATCSLISTLQGRRSGLEWQVTSKVHNISSISAKLVSRCEENCLAKLQFWSTDDPKNPVFQDIEVHMPLSWTPKMYLAAVFTSLCYKHAIYIFEIASSLNNGAEIISINDLCTPYFPVDMHEVLSLIGFGIVCIVGGNF